MRIVRPTRRACDHPHTDSTMIMNEARETTRQTFEFLHQSATSEQHELLRALEEYVNMLHNIIDERNATNA